MITHLQTNTWIKLLFIICLYLTISCNSNRKNTEKQTGIPSPKNLTASIPYNTTGSIFPTTPIQPTERKLCIPLVFYKSSKQENANSPRRKKCKPHLNSCVTNWDI